jgi:cytochrome oxidase Cu insertion factor (SCO1/SenC/PrrC family)
MAMDKNKLKLGVILVTIPFVIILSYLAFQFFSSSRGLGTTSKGQLILPVLDVSQLQLLDDSAQPAYQTFDELTANVSPEDYEPRPWQLLYVGGPTCDTTCQERLYFLRQLHIRLGSEAARVQRVYVLPGSPTATVDAATQQYLAQEQQDMRIIHSDPAVLRQVLSERAQPGQDPLSGHYIYVMDPVGNIMLYFTPENDAEEILDDLDQLLDHSSLG